MGKKTKAKSTFTVESTCWCDGCRREIQIGTGGEYNWTSHILSKAHKATAQTPPISNFFKGTKSESPSEHPAVDVYGTEVQSPSDALPATDASSLTATTKRPFSVAPQPTTYGDNFPILIDNGDSGAVAAPVMSLPEPQNVWAPGGLRNNSSELKLPCPGYHFQPDDNRSPHTSYPFNAHIIHDLPWSVLSRSGKLYLQSNQCTSSGNPAENGVRPCSSCAELQNDDIITSARHRGPDDFDESTPLHDLTMGQMISRLRKMNAEINNLKLKALNDARKIARRNRRVNEELGIEIRQPYPLRDLGPTQATFQSTNGLRRSMRQRGQHKGRLDDKGTEARRTIQKS